MKKSNPFGVGKRSILISVFFLERIIHFFCERQFNFQKTNPVGGKEIDKENIILRCNIEARHFFSLEKQERNQKSSLW